MALLLKVAIGIVILLVIAVAALRIRKLRRDELRELARPVDPRLMAPPPSPYEPSKGFRLLNGPVDSETHRPEPPRPRLESDREYVFSESQMNESVAPTHLRHNEKWALSKSARRTTSFTGLRIAVIAAIIVVIVGVAGLYLQHRDGKNASTTTTTTTTTRPSTTTASAYQTSLVVTFGETIYRVPITR